MSVLARLRGGGIGSIGGAGFERWAKSLRLWVPALVFFALNLGLFGFYRTVLADDAELGRTRLTRRSEALEDLRRQRGRVEAFVILAGGVETGLGEFYADRLATEEAALTRIIAEIKRLSEDAGLVPDRIAYDKQAFEEEEALRRSLTFTVEGDYPALRRLVNFLELSDSFLILERVGLRGDDDGSALLRIDLEVSTLFATSAAAASTPQPDASSSSAVEVAEEAAEAAGTSIVESTASATTADAAEAADAAENATTVPVGGKE